MKPQTCCFTGHRHLPAEKIESIKKRLYAEIDNLYQRGVRSFISGDAIGFDQMTAAAIVRKKEQGYDLRLVFALPCRNQSAKWTIDQRKHYQSLINKADEIIYVSENFTPDCMKKRNFYMVDNSDICICALLHEKSGTGQTVRHAKGRGVKIINVAFTNPENQSFP